MSGSREEMMRVLEQVLAPLVRTDGGELFVVALERSVVALHLAGTYSGCPGTTLTATSIIEPAIRAVDPAAKVIVTSGFQIPPGATLVQGRTRA